MNFTLSLKLYKILIALIVLVFVCFKIHLLHSPYYWDELSPYMKGILYLHDNGLSLQPKALDPIWSRGHPLLFYNYYGLIFKIFGTSVIVGHLTALLISVTSLLSLAYTSLKLFNRNISLCATLLLSIQPLFVSMSIFVLPEIPMLLFSIWYLYLILSRKILLATLIGIVAILTKETGVILVAFGVGHAVLTNRLNILKTIKESAILILPLLFWGIFLLIQKKQHGWYLFPLHVDEVAFDFNLFMQRLKGYSKFFFLEQGRIYTTIIVLGVFIVNIFSKIKSKQLKPNSTLLWNILFLLLTMAVLIPNAYVLRYAISGFGALCIIIAYSINSLPLSQKWSRLVTPLLLAVVTFTTIPHINVDKFDFDKDMSYVHYIKTTKAAVESINIEENEGKFILVDYLIHIGYGDVRLGLVKKQFLHLVYNPQQLPDFIITSNEGSRTQYDNPDNYEEINIFKSGFSETRVLKRKAD